MCNCVYGVRRKKCQCILCGSLCFVAQKQQQNITVFDFCKKEVRKTQKQKKMILFCKVSLLYAAVSSIEELREEKQSSVIFTVSSHLLTV